MSSDSRPFKSTPEQPGSFDKVGHNGLDSPYVPKLLQERLDRRKFVGTSPVSDYEFLRKLGEGTFGVVHLARHKPTGKMVALKKVIMHNEKEGVPITAIREIKILKSLQHENVLSLIDMAFLKGEKSTKRADIYIVLPYFDHDLSGLIENPSVKFTTAQIKCYLKQLLEGTYYLHNNKILHRDIKTANLLIDNKGNLKIADFGLARPMEAPGHEYTACVVTRWYRPPELLLEQKRYNEAIDMWGIGCVFAQMLTSKPLLPGTTDVEQVTLIFQLCGSPTEETMPGWRDLPGCNGVKSFGEHPRTLEQKFATYDKHTVDLLAKFLTLNPDKRITADEALNHPYFFTEPFPANPKTLPTYESSHEIDRHNLKQQPKQQPAQHHPGQHHAGQHQSGYNQSKRAREVDSYQPRERDPLGQGQRIPSHAPRGDSWQENPNPRNNSRRRVDGYSQQDYQRDQQRNDNRDSRGGGRDQRGDSRGKRR